MHIRADSNLRNVIVAAIEPSTASDQVVSTAVAMARLAGGAEIHFVHIVDIGPAPYNASIPMSTLITDGRTYLEGVIAAAAKITGARLSGHVSVGAPAKRIVQIAADLAADLLIVGTHDRRGLARLLGSTSRKVVRIAPCPVLLARAKQNADIAVPAIAPPCTDCIATQRQTNGATLWCERHSRRHVHGHLHYSEPPTYGNGSMLIREEV